MKRQSRERVKAQRAQATLSISMTCFSVIVIASTVLSTPRVAVSAMAATGGDPVLGQSLFEKRCGGCHSLDSDKEGPRLRNVYGRKAGSISTFNYSAAMKSASVTWDENSLDKWLGNTESVVPDNDMDFHVSKPDERADIIEYLRRLSSK